MESDAVLSMESFGEIFTTFKHSAFRLETLQYYLVEGEQRAFADFRAGTSRYLDPWHTEYLVLVRGNVAVGKGMSRVHVITEPVSEYVRFELEWGYEANVDAGERIGIMPTTESAWPSDIPHEDFWLFDDRIVVRMVYNGDGTFRAPELCVAANDVIHYRTVRDCVHARAVPYRAYMARRTV